MEVVVLGISDGNDSDDDMDDCYDIQVSLILMVCRSHSRDRSYVRAPLGFFPKYLAW
jgi:hypothetical protein